MAAQPAARAKPLPRLEKTSPVTVADPRSPRSL
jgi:hypothetical protein